MRESILVVLDSGKKMRIEINASDYTIEKILSIKYKNEK